MKVIKGDLVLKENTIINDDVKVEGNVRCEGGSWDLNCRNLNCRDLDCGNLNCWNLDCWNLNCRDLNCRNLDFYAVAVVYKSFKCKSWKEKRENYIIKCLDGDIVTQTDSKREAQKSQKVKDE